MPRIAGILVIVLMLATGVAIGNLASFAKPVAPVVYSTDQDDANVARAFYDGINVFLGTGEAGGVTTLLAPDYVEHTINSAVVLPAVESLDRLEKLHRSHPELRMTVGDISAGSGTVIVDISTAGSTAYLAGTEAEGEAGARGHELLRIEDGLISERWTFWEMPPLFEIATAIDAALESGERLGLRIEHLRFGTGDYVVMNNPKGFVFVVESGQMVREAVGDLLGSQAAAGDSHALSASAEHSTLEKADWIAEPAGSVVRVRSLAPGSAYVLTATVRPKPPVPNTTISAVVSQSPGVQRSLVVADNVEAPECAQQACTVQIGRLDLSSGQEIPRHLVEGAELLVVVEGELDVRIASESAVSGRPEKDYVIISHQQDIAAGTGLRVNRGADIAYRANGSEAAVFWYITVQSAGNDR